MEKKDKIIFFGKLALGAAMVAAILAYGCVTGGGNQEAKKEEERKEHERQEHERQRIEEEKKLKMQEQEERKVEPGV